MRRSLRMACGMGLSVAVLVAACNKGDDDDSGNDPGGAGLSPIQLCSNVALDTCDKVYMCASEDQRRTLGFPASRLDCNAEALQQLGCTTATQTKICQGTQASTAADAANCSNQVKAASCTDVATKPVPSYAAACGQCAVRP